MKALTKLTAGVLSCALLLGGLPAMPQSLPLLGAEAVEAASATHHWNHYLKGEQLLRQGKVKEAIAELEQAVKQSKQAGYLRKLAEAYERNNQFQRASETYFEEAAIHKRLGEQSGDMNTYFAVLAKAEALHTEIELYLEDSKPVQNTDKLGKFEPESGMYIGAYIEKDSGVEAKKGQKYQAFNELTGKQHAVYFTYHRFGEAFPRNWASQVKAAGGAIHLAVQPEKGLAAVKDDASLRQFAKDAQATGVPVFLRFASEMNGNWVVWNGNPELYKEKFRLVAKVMQEEAPNVAMVWSPAANPKRNIHDYYPGDDWVDWVGLSIYSVNYFNGDKNSPADAVNPLDSLDYVYQAYADRKPIMVSEYGATHFSKASGQSATQFSITKMNMLYHGAKLKYPRLKSLQWFSLNTLTDSHSEERSLNNFSLTENTAVLQAYKKLISDPYYLSKVALQPAAKTTGTTTTNAAAGSRAKGSVTLLADQAVRGKTTGIAWIKTYDPYISKVTFAIDGVQVAERSQYPYTFPINTDKLAAGTHKLKVVVYDSKQRVAATRQVNFKVAAPVGELADKQVRMYLNEKYVHTKTEKIELPAAPYTKEGRVLVPLRFISGILGADIRWQAGTITIKGQSTIILTEGSKTVKVDGKSYTLDVVPETIKGTTFVPLRFVNEHLGGKSVYTSKTQSIDVTPGN